MYIVDIAMKSTVYMLSSPNDGKRSLLGWSMV